MMSPVEAGDRAYELIQDIDRDKDGNPLTLEGAIKTVMLKSPDMAPWRSQALGALYTLLGSGIRWNKHGRLADLHSNNYITPLPESSKYDRFSPSHGMREQLIKMGASKETMERLERQDEARIAKRIAVIEEIELRRWNYDPSGKEGWYPISWYGCNLCVPQGAQADFRQGAIETCNLIIATEANSLDAPIDFPYAELLRTQRYAQDILECLLDTGVTKT